ncbi:unnamed protein product [Peniophora sp. CBMAI 1063]|nr:unnamed protein product [Peniophora sp. CBMAI 1063]
MASQVTDSTISPDPRTAGAPRKIRKFTEQVSRGSPRPRPRSRSASGGPALQDGDAVNDTNVHSGILATLSLVIQFFKKLPGRIWSWLRL